MINGCLLSVIGTTGGRTQDSVRWRSLSFDRVLILRLLFLLFLVVPLIEIYLLIEVGSVLGALPTVALVVLTAIIGAFLLRLQGFVTMQRVRSSMARGEIPAVEMLEGVVLLFCGALLLTPGFFTDTLGFLGLIPALRRGMIYWLLGKGILTSRVRGRPDQGPPGADSHRTIEGQYWHDDDK